MRVSLFFVALMLSPAIEAVETSYIRLKEPKGWTCNQEQSVWLCRSSDPVAKKEAFLVLKAKLAGRADSIESFYESLKAPLPLSNATTNSALSKLYSAETVKISGKDWVRALHLNSVSQNYFTEYLVTLSGDLAIGLELNYHQGRYEKYKNTLSEVIKTIELLDNIASKNLKQSSEGNENLANTSLPTPIMQQESENGIATLSPRRKLVVYLMIGLVIILVALIVRLKIQ